MFQDGEPAFKTIHWLDFRFITLFFLYLSLRFS